MEKVAVRRTNVSVRRQAARSASWWEEVRFQRWSYPRGKQRTQDPTVSGLSARNSKLSNFQWPIAEDSLADISSHSQPITSDHSQKTAWQIYHRIAQFITSWNNQVSIEQQDISPSTSWDNHVSIEQQDIEHSPVGTTMRPSIRNGGVCVCVCQDKKIGFLPEART